MIKLCFNLTYQANCSALTDYNTKSLYVLQCLVEKGYELVSGGTENHLVLVNLKNKVR